MSSGLRYCEAHKAKHHNDHPRLHPEWFALYNNKRWRAYRRMFLAAHPLCTHFDHCHRPATVVDHIKPHDGDIDAFWDETNHQPLCEYCHNQKTARERGWGKR